MISLQELALQADVQSEYEKAIVLNIFRKLVSKMNRDNDLYHAIRTLMKETKNELKTIQVIIERYFNITLTDDYAQLVLQWLNANMRKSGKRKSFTPEYKEQLCKQQNFKCPICGEPFGNNLSKVHIDHIIPWTLVGDELPNNYQCLCEMCNKSKSCHTDYLLRNILKLN